MKAYVLRLQVDEVVAHLEVVSELVDEGDIVPGGTEEFVSIHRCGVSSPGWHTKVVHSPFVFAEGLDQLHRQAEQTARLCPKIRRVSRGKSVVA